MSKDIKFDKETSVNSTESTKLNESNEAKATSKPVELTDNTQTKSEEPKKTNKQSNKTKAVVTYVGRGSWRDSIGDVWSANENIDANILKVRSFDIAEYNARDDIKFMVEYGEMTVVEV